MLFSVPGTEGGGKMHLRGNFRVAAWATEFQDFDKTVLFRQFLPFVGKSFLKCAPTLPSLCNAERVMSDETAIMFFSSKRSRSGV